MQLIIMFWLYLENVTGMLLLFSVLLNIQDDVQNDSNNRVGNHMVFVKIHCTEKITVSYFFVMVMFFVLVLVIVSINSCSDFEATIGQI